MGKSTRFWLNDELVETDEPQGLLVLDFVRRRQLTGTKEGCKEGDCGACTTLVGTLDGGGISYEPVTSCLVPLGEMHGKHVVTVEGLNLHTRRWTHPAGKPPGDGGPLPYARTALSPVQEAMVAFGGTQCGYCTPGFIVSMTWYLMQDTDEPPSMEGFQRSISGNLCRCTGYTSINRAGQYLVDALSEGGEWAEVWQADDRVATLVERGMLPEYFTEMPQRLRALEPAEPDPEDAEFFVAGGTDLYVQKGEELPQASIRILNRYPQMRGIRVEDGHFHVGALTTFEQFAQDPNVQLLIPRIREHMFLIASLHIRNRATLGGNIVNASPIGDMTQLLLALGSELVLREGEATRTVALKDFYLGYKVLDKREREIVTEIVFPAGDARTRINFEKIAKRKALDIATVCSGARLEADDDGVLTHASISMGGVGPTPLLLRETCEYLVGKPINSQTLRDALPIAQKEISPISDVRGSADYKRLLTQQLIVAHFVELYPEYVRFSELAS